ILYRKTGMVSLRSIVDSSPAALERCRKKVGPLDYRTDYQSLLSDPDLSAVHVCTPNSTHFEIASAFIKSGKNVLVEKPLALSSREAYELVELARTHRVVLSTGHFHRFNNGLRALKSTLEPTIPGEPHYPGLEWTGISPLQDQGNVITDPAPTRSREDADNSKQHSEGRNRTFCELCQSQSAFANLLQRQ